MLISKKGGDKPIKKQIAVMTGILTLAGVLIMGAAVVRADNRPDAHDALIEKIASKFSLKTEDVQAVFDDVRSARQKEMQAAFEKRLDQAVSEGKLTQDQKQLILAKKEEFRNTHQSRMESFGSMSNEERRNTMEKNRQEMEAWAASNGIDMSYLMGPGMGHPKGGPGMMGNKNGSGQ